MEYIWEKIRKRPKPERLPVTIRPPLAPTEELCEVETGEVCDEKIEDDETVNSFCKWKYMKLKESDLRLVVITETERRLLFDSETVVPVTSTSAPSNSRLSECKRFHLMRQNPDLREITRMTFGSLSKTDSFKIHLLRNNEGVMFSRIVSVPKSAKLSSEGQTLKESVSSESENSPYSSVHSCDETHRTHRSSQTMDPPEKFTRVRNASLQLEHEYEPRPFSPKCLSKNRRLQLSHRGDISDENNGGRWNSRSRMSSCSSANDEDMNHVAIAVLFNFCDSQFLLQHHPLVEIEMGRLEAQIVKACLTRAHYISIIHQAWRNMARQIISLYNAPRIQRPVWLSLLDEEKRESVAIEFCSTLDELISQYDLKATAFFLSNLVSSVLINHLTWVASVAPPPDRYTKTWESYFLGTKIDVEVFRYPYNTQMAQFLEVQGNVGYAQRLARTVLLGDNLKLITKLVFVLSYFVRCSVLRTNSYAADKWAQKPRIDIVPKKVKLRPPKTTVFFAAHRFNEKAALKVMNGAKHARKSGIVRVENNEWRLPGCDDMLDFAEINSNALAPSLMVGPCENFCSHFVLSGLRKSSVSMNETLISMIDHVKNGESEMYLPSSSPESSSSSAVSDTSQFKPTVIVVGDTDNFSVKVLSGDESCVEECPMSSPCEAVIGMFERFHELYQLDTEPFFLISFIEDSLGEILAKSLSLLEMVAGHDVPKVPSTMPSENIAKVIGCDCSDLRLVANVAAVYFPPVLNLLT